ncbi:MAG: Crp/Fnr family transcriptional regulator [Thermoflexales bacterium]|nr:Crp/Fnr family transcriptional regulator [Thermoflexales bacterium]
MDERTVQALRRVPLFSGLPERVLRRLAEVAVRREYASGETVILEGEPCRYVYFVAEGEARVVRTASDGREQVLARLGPGGALNTVPPFLPRRVNHATVQALTPAVLYAVPAPDFLRLVDECPELARVLLEDFARRLDRLSHLVEDLSLRTVRGRLARFLLEHAEGGKGAEAGAATVVRRWTQEEIAAQIGTVREVVARTLRAFADAGLLKIEGHRIILLDREGLEMEAER